MEGMYQGFGSPISVPQAPKKGGMFGSGVGAADVIQALLSGYLASRGGPTGAMALQMMQQKRQQALEESQYQQHRQDNLADYAEQQKIQQQYASPAQPHYFEDNMGNQWAIGADGQPKMVHKDDFPYKLVPNGLGGVVPVNLQSLMGGMGQQAPQVSEEDWNNGKPIGGPPQTGAGGFSGY